MSLTKPNHQESSYTTATQASISKVIARYLAVQRGQNNKCFTGKLTFSGIRDNRCSQLARNWCRRVAEKLTGPRFQCPFQTDIGSFESGLQFEAPLFNCFSWNVNKFDFLIAYFAQLNKSSGVKIWLLMCRRLAPVLWVFFTAPPTASAILLPCPGQEKNQWAMIPIKSRLKRDRLAKFLQFLKWTGPPSLKKYVSMWRLGTNSWIEALTAVHRETSSCWWKSESLRRLMWDLHKFKAILARQPIDSESE